LPWSTCAIMAMLRISIATEYKRVGGGMRGTWRTSTGRRPADDPGGLQRLTRCAPRATARGSLATPQDPAGLLRPGATLAEAPARRCSRLVARRPGAERRPEATVGRPFGAARPCTKGRAERGRKRPRKPRRVASGSRAPSSPRGAQRVSGWVFSGSSAALGPIDEAPTALGPVDEAPNPNGSRPTAAPPPA